MVPRRAQARKAPRGVSPELACAFPLKACRPAGANSLLFAIQVFQTVEPGALAEVTARLPWSALKVYDLNAPGQNHGLLLATSGWARPANPGPFARGHWRGP